MLEITQIAIGLREIAKARAACLNRLRDHVFNMAREAFRLGNRYPR